MSTYFCGHIVHFKASFHKGLFIYLLIPPRHLPTPNEQLAKTEKFRYQMSGVEPVFSSAESFFPCLYFHILYLYVYIMHRNKFISHDEEPDMGWDWLVYIKTVTLIALVIIYSIVIHLHVFHVQEIGYQHGKLLFTGWARGDIIENMLKDHRSADYTDSKKTDVSHHVWQEELILDQYSTTLDANGSKSVIFFNSVFSQLIPSPNTW